MFKTKHDFKRGDFVRLKISEQRMEITYVTRHLFKHDKISVIYQKADGDMVNLSGFHPESLLKFTK